MAVMGIIPPVFTNSVSSLIEIPSSTPECALHRCSTHNCFVVGFVYLVFVVLERFAVILQLE